MRRISRFRRRNSGDLASDRLHLILAADRTDCSPEIMDMVREDLSRTVPRSLDIDRRWVVIPIGEETYAPRTRPPALEARIPRLALGSHWV